MNVNGYRIGQNMVLVLIMCLALSFDYAYSETLTEKLLSVKWGSASGSLGYNKRSKETEDEGPISFYVSAEGYIYIGCGKPSYK